MSITKESPQFLFMQIDNKYIVKYDGYREKDHWTLLRANKDRILDGDFYDVVAYLTGFKREEILEEEYCPICQRLMVNGECIKSPHSPLEKFDIFQSEPE